MLSYEYDTNCLFAYHIFTLTSPLLYDPNKLSVGLWKGKTFLFLCEEVFVSFQINYEYQIQIRWSMVYMSDQLILAHLRELLLKD